LKSAVRIELVNWLVVAVKPTGANVPGAVCRTMPTRPLSASATARSVKPLPSKSPETRSRP
jgi:hypothetical protein